MKIAVWGREEEILTKIFEGYKFIENEVILDAIDQILNLIKSLKSNGNYVISLKKVVNFHDIDLFIFIDFPILSNEFVKKAFNAKKINFLITFENQLICSNNFNKDYLSLFNKVFTWNDELIDNIKYFKYLRTYSSRPPIVNFEERNKLICMISMNKVINFSKSLYKKRLECIKWFENNFFLDFDLYGLNWDRYYFKSPKILRILNRVDLITKFFSYNFKCYKGTIAGSLIDKINVLKKYKFSVAFENDENLQGYITEKIFHCFFALTIPVYLGAKNIHDYIPRNCFIDMRDFDSYEKLYIYIKKMDELTYTNYINNIIFFLSSDKYKPFTNEYSSATVLKEVNKLFAN